MKMNPMLIVWHLLAVLAIQPVLPSVSPSKVVPSELAAAIIQPKKKYRPKDPSRKFRYRALVAATGKTLLYFGLGTLVWGALYGIILSIQGWKWGITGLGWGYMFAGLIVIGALVLLTLLVVWIGWMINSFLRLFKRGRYVRRYSRCP